jgi:alkylated DNA repair protein alkB homolog 7
LLTYFIGSIHQYPLIYSRRYDDNHWDVAIQKFREVELFEEDDDLKAILQPIKELVECNHSSPLLPSNQVFSGTWLPCHAIDLHESGALNAHVDSVRFSGNIIAGLSLSSESIMRLRPVPRESEGVSDSYIDLWLPKRSLYVLCGESRYHYTHELLSTGSLFGGETIVRSQRLSVIFRDAKKDLSC